MRRLIPSIATRLDDTELERARRNLDDRVTELQGLPFADATIISNISLADAQPTRVPHGLGRVAKWIGPSCVRGATATGRIVETRDGSPDATTLTATGWGATITIDLVVL